MDTFSSKQILPGADFERNSSKIKNPTPLSDWLTIESLFHWLIVQARNNLRTLHFDRVSINDKNRIEFEKKWFERGPKFWDPK